MSAPAPTVPWIPPAVRALLLADPAFAAACYGRCSTRAPGDVTVPYATVQVPGGFPLDASAGVWSPLVQVDGWCAPPGPDGVDPEDAVWRIASAAGAVLSRVRNVAWLNMHFSARVVSGPLPDVDTTRGTANPLYRALVRAELTIHAR